VQNSGIVVFGRSRVPEQRLTEHSNESDHVYWPYLFPQEAEFEQAAHSTSFVASRKTWGLMLYYCAAVGNSATRLCPTLLRTWQPSADPVRYRASDIRMIHSW
jgi:hypothetical protein